jgi:hypothetical protein
MTLFAFARAERERVAMKDLSMYRDGSRFARAMLIGLGSAKFATDVSFLDGQGGKELSKAKVDLLWAMGGLVGASQGIEDLIEKAGRQIAGAIAEKRGIAKRADTGKRSLEPQVGSSQQDTKAAKCQG